jgi:ParB-like chromosome segregation protein Spo0J
VKAATCPHCGKTVEPKKPYELAEELRRYAKDHPEKTYDAIGKDFGISRSYVTNLLAIREKAIPEIWNLFKKGKLTCGEAREIVKGTREMQKAHASLLEDWNLPKP